jgi:Flp pilus assembly protein TadB
MAQTKKKRRKKRRGTQSGRVETRRSARPRNRQEAQARARSKGSGKSRQAVDRRDQEPTWRGAFIRGAVASGLFVLVVALVFQRPIAPALGLGVLMLAFYVPMGYFIDRFFYNRRQRQKQAQIKAGKDS